jgi:DNA-binding HxlR family transcriptional regulator
MESDGEVRAVRGPAAVDKMFEECVGCKWTLHVLRQVRLGVTRPGALERTADGLTAKVLNERLVKLVGFGLLERTSYPEIPPRVEYTLTPFGRRFAAILDQVEQLRVEFGGGPGA